MCVYLCSEGGVGVVLTARDAILLGNTLDLLYQGNDAVVLLVCLSQSLLELLVGIYQPLLTHTQPTACTHLSESCDCNLELRT